MIEVTKHINVRKTKDSCLSCMNRDKLYKVRIATGNDNNGLVVILCDDCLASLGDQIQSIRKEDQND